jgi:HK97 gp10 family phage protein
MIGIDFKINSSFYKKVGATYDKIIDDSLSDICLETENIAKREAPVDTGALKRSINADCSQKLVKTLKSSVNYWVYLQWGTKYISANPFITRTVKGVVPKIPKVFEANMTKHEVK